MKGHFFKIFNKYTNKFSTSVTEVPFRFKKKPRLKWPGLLINCYQIIFFLQPLSMHFFACHTKLVSQ